LKVIGQNNRVREQAFFRQPGEKNAEERSIERSSGDANAVAGKSGIVREKTALAGGH